MNNMGLQSNIAPQHPLVDETHRKLRLKWAQDRRTWEIERFYRVCFSDESKLCPQKQGRPRVRVRKGEVLPPQYFR